MTILISPFCKYMRNGKPNPKNFPYWIKLIEILLKEGHKLIQIGVKEEKALVEDFRIDLSFKELKTIIQRCDLFISVDTWLQHAANHYGKKGIVIFSQSDPNVFGYPQNINLLKDIKYLRPQQFWLWEQAEYKEEAFVSAEEVAFQVGIWK